MFCSSSLMSKHHQLHHTEGIYKPNHTIMQQPVLNTGSLTSVIKNSMASILWFYSQTLINVTPLTVDTHDVMDSPDSLIYL